MIQKLALAQSLLGDPDLLILDEPTAGLDAMSRVNIIDIICNLKENGKTIILNSHILNDVEKVADRGVIMDNGEIIKNLDREDFNNNLEKNFIESFGGRRDVSYISK